MKPTLSLFWSYIKALSRNWVLWLSIGIDLIARIIQVFPFFQIIPQIYFQITYTTIAFIGLVWAGFITYLNLLARIPDESKPLNPEISLLFKEGNEYSFGFQDNSIYIPNKEDRKIAHNEFNTNPNEVLKDSTLPKSELTLQLRIENTGLVPIRILKFGGSVEEHRSKLPLHFMVPDAKNYDDSNLSYPMALPPNNSFHFKVVVSIHPSPLLSDAQVAARFPIWSNDHDSVNIAIWIEAIQPSGVKIYNFQANHEISTTPLFNLYIDHWKYLSRKDLVELTTMKSYNTFS